MFWANFLHIYQPPNQDPDVLKEITILSYLPLLKGVLNNPKTKLCLNINACLLDLFAQNNYQEVLALLRKLLEKDQLEITGSAKYHAFLPLLSESEVKRQIEQNEKTLKFFFGDLWKKNGFFSPELAYDFKTAKIVKEMGYQWILAPQISYGPQPPSFDTIYQIKGLEPFSVFFRDKRVSILILAGYAHNAQAFFEEISDALENPNRYLTTIMDGETFGHHRPGLEKFLEELYQSEKLQTVFISDLPNLFNKREIVEPRAATWSNEEQDFWLDKEKHVVRDNPFLLWKDPSSEIHRLQWEFTDWVAEKVEDQKFKVKGDKEKTKWDTARLKLDQAISSDQYWWASAKPWWSLEMIENGGYFLKDVINTLFDENSEEGKKAFDYYLRIILEGFRMQREGIVKGKYKEMRNPILDIPFKERTSPEWFNQIILEFEDEMKKAAQSLDFEKAGKWRDAISKLSSGNDFFDAVHVVDQLWTARRLPSLKSYFEMKPEEISDFAKKHLLTTDEKA